MMAKKRALGVVAIALAVLMTACNSPTGADVDVQATVERSVEQTVTQRSTETATLEPTPTPRAEAVVDDAQLQVLSFDCESQTFGGA